MSGCVIALGLLTSILFPNLRAATEGFLLTGFWCFLCSSLAYGLAGKSKTMSTEMAIAAVSPVGYLGFLFGPAGHSLYRSGRQFKMVICVDCCSRIFCYCNCK